MTTAHHAILSNGQVAWSTDPNPHTALAELTALAEASDSTVIAMVRVRADEWGNSHCQQVPLPLRSPTEAPMGINTPAVRAWLAQHDQQVAHAAWNRGYSHAHWQEQGYTDGRDHIPAHLADQLEHWNPYPIPDTTDQTAAELTAKDQET